MQQAFSVDLSGKVAVVTGGGGVLCAEMARALAASGARIAIVDLKLEAAEAVAAEIRTAGGEAIGLAANVLERASLEQAAAEVLSRLGPCDLLINGAGGNHPKGTTTREAMLPEDITEADPAVVTFFTLDPEGMRFVFDLNFLGTLLPSQVFAKQMIGREGCSILNISSMNAFRPLTKIPAYSAAKAAVSNFTQWLAVHLAPVGVRVNAIAPGFFVTNQNRALLFSPTGEPTARAGKILNNTPMKRFGEANELTGTLLWLACEEASGFVNGIVVPVDGGFSAYSGV
ncbi:SDR family oxidoreductase [Uliginosibacterium sp. 31-16]|uniref:SDR family oxidoreductase n=1 Tax=Uliginosibacterium sp. 31-16 TaxID=3068315 RepID=UPI00273FDA51|nr:SDR family oxidoreductase [Uliginosibacterium sp. 31-16]MDP5238761.1 SDR family oxidoreductase [Uliginosibacterium sp. 31-16]